MLEIFHFSLLRLYNPIFSRSDQNSFLIRKGPRCDNGWFSLLSNLFSNILHYEESKKDDPLYSPIIILDIKEKFGRLNIYFENGDDYVEGMINFAENMSLSICECCGTNKSDILGYTDRYMSVVCKECYDRDDKYKKHGEFISGSILNAPIYNLRKQIDDLLIKNNE